MSLIEKLTPEEEALIPVYRQKWRTIALSTERIDREKAAEVVKAAYTAIGKQQPEIIFCDSPYAGLTILLKKHPKLNLNNINLITLNNQIINYICINLTNKSLELSYLLDTQLLRELPIFNRDFIIFEYVLEKQSKIKHQPKINLDPLWLKSQHLTSHCCWVDFYVSVLNCSYSKIRWETLQSLSRFCGWISPFEKFCIVCDRPLHLRFDNQNILHAEGEPAIEFTDGFSLYSYHGVTLPEIIR